MTGRLGHAALALGLAHFIGCAQGYDYSLDEEPPLAGGFAAGIGSTGTGRGGAPSQAGTNSQAGRSGGAGMTMYMGDPCERGETEVCTCEGGLGTGIRTCRRDDLSPTMGSFSACEACVPDDDEDPAGMGGGGSGSGAAGRGGAGGSSSGSAGAGSSSAGRSGSGGTSGRTGSSGSSGGSNDPAWCFFVPIPLPGVCD